MLDSDRDVFNEQVVEFKKHRENILNGDDKFCVHDMVMYAKLYLENCEDEEFPKTAEDARLWEVKLDFACRMGDIEANFMKGEIHRDRFIKDGKVLLNSACEKIYYKNRVLGHYDMDLAAHHFQVVMKEFDCRSSVDEDKLKDMRKKAEQNLETIVEQRKRLKELIDEQNKQYIG